MIKEPENSIEMVEVESSNVAAVGYDAETRTMTIRFHSGHGGFKYSEYQYCPVLRATFDLILRSPSKGRAVSLFTKTFAEVGQGSVVKTQ
jgi:hypothetical protein